MLKPLTQEQIDRIIETGIRHFADKGFAGANVNKIAAEAGVSVGVVYKYYQGKQDLFRACVERSLDYLDRVFAETRQQGGTLMEMIGNLIRQNQIAARKHPEYFRLYHQITVSGAPAGPEKEVPGGAEAGSVEEAPGGAPAGLKGKLPDGAPTGPEEKVPDGAPAGIADLIEGRSARMYRELLTAAKDAGEVRAEMDPALFAFFFDNLMMTLQLTYACEYYRDRYRVYCDDKITEGRAQDEKIRSQLMKFIEGALGT